MHEMDEQGLASERGLPTRSGLEAGAIAAPYLPSVGPDPGAGVRPGLRREVTCRIVREADLPECPFWVGFSAKGPHTPFALLDQGNTSGLLAAAANEGIRDEGPLVLCDTELTPARTVLLLPIPEPNFRARTLWLEETLAALGAWSPTSLGFYLAPTAQSPDPKFELLLMTLRQLVLETGIQTIYLLTGEHGLNPMLNAALRLKTDLVGESVGVYIFH